MKIFGLTLFITIFFSSFSNAQFIVNLTVNSSSDTVKTCINQNITFVASATYNGSVITGVNYLWDFDDTEKISDIDLVTVQHSFNRRKGFRVRVIAEYNGESTYDILPVEIGLIADFSETKTDISDTLTGICPGEEFTLMASAKKSSWEGSFLNNFVELFPYELENPYTYSSPIDHKEFQFTDVLNSATDIESIGLKIEHENLSNLQIKLVCPNQSEIILKDFGGEAKYMGEPVLDDNGIEGTPYWYYWTNTPEFSTMNNESANYETLPTGNYLSENDFSNLVGCPLNGEWTIEVTDNVATDNGFIWEWSLDFVESILPENFTYQNNYLISSGTWSGFGVNGTNSSDGTAKVESPMIPGVYPYTYLINDNFGCFTSTNISANVERANFSVKKDGTAFTGIEMTSEIGDKLSFEDSTSWAAETMWDFGDDSEYQTTKNIEAYYYFDKGYYRTLMKATSAKGCVDYDTAYIVIAAIDSVTMFTDKNFIITPNGDGTNDFFTVFDGDSEYPGGKSLDSLTFTHKNSIDKDAANISEIKGRIFNRYGNTVCEWNTIEDALYGWDGTLNNNNSRYVADGLYFYVVVIRIKKDEKERVESYKGAIYVLKNNR